MVKGVVVEAVFVTFVSFKRLDLVKWLLGGRRRSDNEKKVYPLTSPPPPLEPQSQDSAPPD